MPETAVLGHRTRVLNVDRMLETQEVIGATRQEARGIIDPVTRFGVTANLVLDSASAKAVDRTNGRRR